MGLVSAAIATPQGGAAKCHTCDEKHSGGWFWHGMRRLDAERGDLKQHRGILRRELRATAREECAAGGNGARREITAVREKQWD